MKGTSLNTHKNQFQQQSLTAAPVYISAEIIISLWHNTASVDRCSTVKYISSTEKVYAARKNDEIVSHATICQKPFCWHAGKQFLLESRVADKNQSDIHRQIIMMTYHTPNCNLIGWCRTHWRTPPANLWAKKHSNLGMPAVCTSSFLPVCTADLFWAAKQRRGQ